MTWRGRAEYDPARHGVRIALGETIDETRSRILRWTGHAENIERDPGTTLPDDAFLALDDEVARALHEALADYYGGTGHDTRALRADYDAERKRVDKLIEHLIGRGTP